MQLRRLSLFLGFSAFAWGVSAVGAFVSWPQADQLLEGLGAKPIAHDPMRRERRAALTQGPCW